LELSKIAATSDFARSRRNASKPSIFAIQNSQVRRLGAIDTVRKELRLSLTIATVSVAVFQVA
jgi:hypothetical protein